MASLCGAVLPGKAAGGGSLGQGKVAGSLVAPHCLNLVLMLGLEVEVAAREQGVTLHLVR